MEWAKHKGLAGYSHQGHRRGFLENPQGLPSWRHIPWMLDMELQDLVFAMLAFVLTWVSPLGIFIPPFYNEHVYSVLVCLGMKTFSFTLQGATAKGFL